MGEFTGITAFDSTTEAFVRLQPPLPPLSPTYLHITRKAVTLSREQTQSLQYIALTRDYSGDVELTCDGFEDGGVTYRAGGIARLAPTPIDPGQTMHINKSRFTMVSVLSAPLPTPPPPPADSVCRIFYQSSTRGNLLLSLCKCNGSAKYVHEECIRKWTEARWRKVGNENCFSIRKSLLECEVCTASFLEWGDVRHCFDRSIQDKEWAVFYRPESKTIWFFRLSPYGISITPSPHPITFTYTHNTLYISSTNLSDPVYLSTKAGLSLTRLGSVVFCVKNWVVEVKGRKERGEREGKSY